MKKRVKMLVAMMMVAAIAIGMAGTPKSAHAGWNGQQLQMTVYGSNFTKIKIEGRNQWGTGRTWEQGFNPSKTNYQLRNWWWKGEVKVTFTLTSGRDQVCYGNVPGWQAWTDWWNVGYNANTDKCFSN